MNIKYHSKSFKEAFSGLVYAFSKHHNFKVHLFISIIVLMLAAFFSVSKIEFIILVLTILLGFTVEFINTAIESVCDLVTLEWRKDIKIAKDVSAAMMLIVAFGSVGIGLLIFVPYFLKLF